MFNKNSKVNLDTFLKNKKIVSFNFNDIVKQ